MLEQYQTTLKNARNEADEIITASRKSAKAEAERIIAEGRAEAIALAESANKQMETERQAMLARFNLEAAALVMAASARLVQREISGDDNRRFANMLLDELAAQRGR